MKLGAQDLRLLKEFVGGAGEGTSSPRFSIVGGRLDGSGLGGHGLAEWKGGVIICREPHGTWSQSINRKLRSLAKHVWGPHTRKVLDAHEATLKNLAPKHHVLPKEKFKLGDKVRVIDTGSWVGNITFGPVYDGGYKYKVTRDFDGLQKWWNEGSLEKISMSSPRKGRPKKALTATWANMLGPITGKL